MPTTLAARRAAPALEQELAAAVEALRRVTVLVRTRGKGVGAGVAWDARGLIITNAHVARGDAATIQFWDGTTSPARVVGRDRQRDLAALELEAPSALAVAVVRTAPALRVGELVMAVGHPDGDAGAVTLGIIHAVEGGSDHAARWVRADVRLAPGYSGGPLADAAGHVVGINTLIHGGLALAVPAATVDAWVRAGRQPALARRARRRGAPATVSRKDRTRTDPSSHPRS
ncbi:MAG TPA: trypsin-like peptidase domain-containing protein [Gemmatimonadales bacterium]|nr:trypsin-like peptidase domain-containing protein [Gemmatimonadales bacterium]